MTTPIDRAVSAKIANLGLLAAMLVVAIHVKWPEPAACGMVGSFVEFFVHRVAACAVPFFFGVSGYLLAGRFGESGWWLRAVRKRAVTLGIPFVLWGLLFLCWMACVDVLGNALADRPLTGGLRGAWGSVRIFMGANLFFAPGLVPLWYVRNLMILILVSPLVKVAVDRFGGKSVGALVVLEMAFELAKSFGVIPASWISFFTYGFSVIGLLCFSAGIALRAGRMPFLASVTLRQSGVLYLASAVLVESLAARSAKCAAPLQIFSYAALVLFAWKLAGTRRWPVFITECAFPIFVMHCFVIDAFRILPDFRRAVPHALALAFFVWVVASLLPIAATVVLARFAPKAVAILFGGRAGRRVPGLQSGQAV